MTQEAYAVVVPARDEQELLPACLDAVERAVAELAAGAPGIPCHVVVVLDSCRDGSAGVVASRPGVTAVVVDHGCVGAARASGVAAAAAWADAQGRRLWVACTDADSEVPAHWLLTQHRLAATGARLVVGTVHPRPGDLTPVELEAWRERHSTRDGHDHVHGANLGFCLETYRGIGGFLPLPLHEDVELVTTLRELGTPAVATGAIPVMTSGRRVARAPGGFAAYLAGLRS